MFTSHSCCLLVCLVLRAVLSQTSYRVLNYSVPVPCNSQNAFTTEEVPELLLTGGVPGRGSYQHGVGNTCMSSGKGTCLVSTGRWQNDWEIPLHCWGDSFLEQSLLIALITCSQIQITLLSINVSLSYAFVEVLGSKLLDLNRRS